MERGELLAFGPVPSRRLGRSLGINNIPAKICTYSCVYCQLGRTLSMEIDRQAFYEPETIAQAVFSRVEQAEAAGATIDYLTFVPDGEPTLDIHLGRAIALLQPLGIPVAVITNGSLIDQALVRTDLCEADWVSLKVDTVSETVWREIDRPHRRLKLDSILAGAVEFADLFVGELVTETMLVSGLNDTPAEMMATADFIAHLRPSTAYLAIPTRPPAESWAQPPQETELNRAFHLFGERLAHVEYLIGYEGNAFAATGNVVEDLLGITAVHPMRAEAVSALLARVGADWSVVDSLLVQGELVAVPYAGATYFVRRMQ